MGGPREIKHDQEPDDQSVAPCFSYTRNQNHDDRDHDHDPDRLAPARLMPVRMTGRGGGAVANEMKPSTSAHQREIFYLGENQRLQPRGAMSVAAPRSGLSRNYGVRTYFYEVLSKVGMYEVRSLEPRICARGPVSSFKFVKKRKREIPGSWSGP